MLKRPLLLAAIMFLLGILLEIYEVNTARIISLGAGMVICMRAFSKKHLPLCVVMIVLTLMGMVRMNIAEEYRKEIINSYNRTVKSTEMTVTDFSDGGKVIVNFRNGGKTHKAYLRVKSGIQLYPGDIVQGEVTFSEPVSSKINSGDFSSYLSSLGVYLNATAETVHIADRYTKGIMGKVYTVRRYMDKIGEKHFSGTPRAFYNAMVFGDKRLITDDMTSALQGAGLNHIAVVSGMHLSVLIAALMFLMNTLFGKRRTGNLVAILGAVCIMLVTGAGASVMRAFVMCVLYQLSRVLYRESDALTSLGFAVLVMLIINPCLVFNAGFVLSVLSVLGILLFSKKLFNVLEPFIPKAANSAVSVSVAASLTVTPAIVYYFGIITPYAVISNLLVFALATLFVVVGMLLVVLEGIPVIGAGLIFSMKLMSEVTESVCYGVSGLPKAIFYTGKMGTLFLVMWIFVLVLIFMYPVKTEKKPRFALAFGIALMLVFLFDQSGKIEASFVSYGGKTMSAVYLDDGGAILIDCPDSYDAAVQEENSEIPFKWGILTAEDTENMLSFAQNGRLEAVIVPEALFTEEQREELLIAAEEKRMRIIFLPDGKRISLGVAKAEFLPIGESGKALKLYYKGKSLVTLQGLESKDIEKLCGEKIKIECDYLKLPFAVLAEKTNLSELCSGKLLQTEKNIVIK